MAFEREVIPLFLICACIVSILELVVGCLLLKNRKTARNYLIDHTVSMSIALAFLVRCIFGNWLSFKPLIPSISNSACIGLFGFFWTISVGFFLAAVSSPAEEA